MRKNISHTEQNRRKYRKMLNSLSNKMDGSNIIWFNSLSLKAQYALLFKYNRYKNDSKFKFKHFINRERRNFIPTKTNIRNATIDQLIEI